MNGNKIIAVVGATGAQGGGLVRAILSDPEGGFSARALTRNPDSDKAKELKSMGAEVVKADVDSADSLKEAFSGVYGAFCVTFFWDHFSPEKEMQHAKNMAEAAKSANVKHVIWSTLEDTRKFIPLDDDRMPTLMEKYKVPHFDAKGESNHFFTDLYIPTTLLHTSFYWENMIFFGMGPKPDPNGTLVFTLPMGDQKLSGIAAEDIGKCAYGIFKKDGDYIGKTVGIAGDHQSGAEMAKSMTEAFGREVKYQAIEPSVYRGLGFPGADDLGNMFQFYHDFADEFVEARSLDFSRSINPDLQSFDEWLNKNKDRIPLE